jgi:ribosomal protein S1
MNTTTLRTGDQLVARVTQSTPFGALIESESGIPGLVLESSAQVGDTLTVRVESFDAEKVRFSAVVA